MTRYWQLRGRGTLFGNRGDGLRGFKVKMTFGGRTDFGCSRVTIGFGGASSISRHGWRPRLHCRRLSRKAWLISSLVSRSAGLESISISRTLNRSYRFPFGSAATNYIAHGCSPGCSRPWSVIRSSSITRAEKSHLPSAKHSWRQSSQVIHRWKYLAKKEPRQSGLLRWEE